jgi:hypothetical protein
MGAEAAKPRGLPNAEKHEAGRQGGIVAPVKAYNADADVVINGKKDKKKRKSEAAAEEEPVAEVPANGTTSEKKKKVRG